MSPVGPFLEWHFLIVNVPRSDDIKRLFLDLVFRSLDHIGDDFSGNYNKTSAFYLIISREIESKGRGISGDFMIRVIVC